MRNIGSKYDLASKDDLEALSREFETAMAQFGARLTQAEKRVVDEMHLRVKADNALDTRVQSLDEEDDAIQRDMARNFVDMAAATIRLGVGIDLRLRALEQRTFTRRAERLWRALQRILKWKRSGSSPSSSATSSSSPSSMPPRTDLDIDAAWKKPSEQYPIF